MATKRDYYEVLSVARNANGDEIKKAYKKLAIKFHPDRNQGDPSAAERFKECAEAFDVLSNAEKRSRYDRFGHAGVNGSGGAGFSDVDDIFDAFGDLFGGVFGGSRQRRGGGGQRRRRGESLRTAVRIDLHQAAQGCTRELEIERKELCSGCDGSGAAPGSTPETCDYCGGHGQVVQSQGFFRVQTTCPACRGEGRVNRHKCAICHGAGREAKKVQLEVKIPPGVDNGMQLRVSGEGEPGSLNGPRGDLYVDILVNDHPFLQRQGHDLLCHIPVTYSQAALGTQIDIPVLSGKHAFTVPPGTQPGEILKLRGEGMPDPHGGPRGDLLVEVQVEVPKKLSREHEELLRKLAEQERASVSHHHKSFFERLKDYFVPDEDDE